MSGPRIGSMCSGYGGLDLAVQAVIGGDLAWVADNDPGAAAILAHHYPNVPNLGDMAAVDWPAAEPVDIVCAGFPCQDISYAGRGEGIQEGNRSGLWYSIANALGVLRPGLVILENVAAIVGRRPGLDVVLADLARLGFDVRWGCLRAAAVGAPHGRNRWFAVAYPCGAGLEVGAVEHHGPQLPSAERGRGDAPADPDRAPGGRHEPRPGPGPLQGTAVAERAPEQPGRLHSGSGDPSAMAPADTNGDGLPRGEERDGAPLSGQARHEQRRVDPQRRVLDWGIYEPAIRRWERILGRPAPRPTVPVRTGDRLNPAFVEWMQGLPEGWVTDVPGLSRNAQLKALGNGVVPQQAVAALRLLLAAATPATEPAEATPGEAA